MTKLGFRPIFDKVLDKADFQAAVLFSYIWSYLQEHDTLRKSQLETIAPISSHSCARSRMALEYGGFIAVTELDGEQVIVDISGLTLEGGPWHHRRRAEQLIDFSGLGWGGGRRPTDIDAYAEFWDWVYLVAETKVQHTPDPEGQRKALERFCDVVTGTQGPNGRRRVAYLIRTEHNTPPNQDILLADTQVLEYRHQYRWHPPEEAVTYGDFTQRILRENGILPPLK